MGSKLHFLPDSIHRLRLQGNEHHQRLEGTGEPGKPASQYYCSFKTTHSNMNMREIKLLRVYC